MRVLQVEDDEATARTVERTLKSKGFSCETAALGEQAVELALANDYDLILLDIMLPDIDGYEVLRRLRAADVRAPVVVQSALIGRHELHKGAGFGVDDFLAKPFSTRELSARVDAALERAPAPPAPTPALAPAGPQAQDEFDRRTKPRKEDKPSRRDPRLNRSRTLKSAQIIYKNSNCVTDCIVINMSEGGAALRLNDVVDIPETFR